MRVIGVSMRGAQTVTMKKARLLPQSTKPREMFSTVNPKLASPLWRRKP